MGVRITGISTPVGGITWEYTKAEERTIPLLISPGQKIKVFISSICGVEKYDKVRIELKKAIESTQLADVYTFEEEGASTLPAGVHYTWALQDSDICIFLIDNADGINPGVQVEIDTVKKHNNVPCDVEMALCVSKSTAILLLRELTDDSVLIKKGNQKSTILRE